VQNKSEEEDSNLFNVNVFIIIFIHVKGVILASEDGKLIKLSEKGKIISITFTSKKVI